MIDDPVKATAFADNIGLAMMLFVFAALIVVGFLWATTPAPTCDPETDKAAARSARLASLEV